VDVYLTLLALGVCALALRSYYRADTAAADPFVALPAAFDEAQPRMVRRSKICQLEKGPAGWSRVWVRGQPHALGVARSYEDLLKELSW